MNPVRIEQWSVSLAGPVPRFADPAWEPHVIVGNFYGHPDFPEGERLQTSFIHSVEGKLVHCTRRDYILGEPDPAYIAWCAQQGKPLDPENPIRMIS